MERLATAVKFNSYIFVYKLIVTIEVYSRSPAVMSRSPAVMSRSLAVLFEIEKPAKAVEKAGSESCNMRRMIKSGEANVAL